MADYIKAHVLANNKEQKIDVMASYLEDTARKEYRDKVKEDGRFRTYEDLCKWLLLHYAPSDPVNTVWNMFVQY